MGMNKVHAFSSSHGLLVKISPVDVPKTLLSPPCGLLVGAASFSWAGIEHWGHVTLIGGDKSVWIKECLSRQHMVSGTSLLYLIVHIQP